MYKFVLDADGAIKLAKAGVLERLAENSNCIIPQEVYAEVLRGKEKMRQDAFITETLVNEGKLGVVENAKTEKKKPGEDFALAAFKTQKADAVITDDTKFISSLKRENIKFIIPSDIVVWLAKKGELSKQEGLTALEKMRASIREDAYTESVSLIRGEQNDDDSLPA